MKNLPILVCMACVALSVSLNILPEEEERYRENMRQLNRLADSGGLEKMRVLLGSEDFDRLLSDLKPIFGGSSDPDNQFDGDLIDPDFSFPVFGGEDDPDHSRPILGGEDDPDHSRLILGGDDDPDQSRLILGGEDDPDHSRPILGGEDDPDHSRLILGGEDDPDHSRPILGGENDPDHSRLILGGEDDPDHSRLILGGEDDPDQSRLILGGKDDPDHSRLILGGEDDPDQSRHILGGEDDPDHSRLILGGEDDPDHHATHPSSPTPESFATEGYSRPILGGTDDPDQSRPILGGEDDPDHSRLIPGGENDPDHESIFGEQSDPEQDIRVTTDSEKNEMVDYPGKFERRVPKSGNIKPIRGKSPAKQQNKKGSQTDIPIGVDPCLPSDLPDPRSQEELCETAECPRYQVMEIEGTCGFELRRYNKGVWVMTEMNTKKGISEAFTEASEKLMEYMNGENDGNVIMEATKPKTVVYIMKDKSSPKTAYLGQFLPASYHENPPQPSEGKPLILKHNPELQYYVRSFGGKPSIDHYRREFAMLAAAIKKSGLNAVWYMRFFHEYSDPRDETQRHEVAVIVAPSES